MTDEPRPEDAGVSETPPPPETPAPPPAPPPPYQPGYAPVPGYGVPPHWVAQVPPPVRPRRSAVTTIVIVLALVFIGTVLIGLFTHFISYAGGGPSLGGDVVGVVAVQGIIRDGGEGGLFAGPPGARGIMAELRAAGKDDDVKSVLLLIDSPGGSAAASAAIYEEIMRLRQEKHKKVVACMTDVAASGGYYIAAACDKIVAQGSTTTGSIGVIFGGMGYYGLMKKLGITDETITAGKYKAMGHPTRPMTAEEHGIISSMLEDIYTQFVTAVAEGRKMDVNKVRQLAQGRVYTGSQAAKLGLVDQLGNYYDALKLAADLGGLKGEPKVKHFGQTKSLLDELTSTRSGLQQLLAGPSFGEAVPVQGPMLILPYEYRIQPVMPVPVTQ